MTNVIYNIIQSWYDGVNTEVLTNIARRASANYTKMSSDKKENVIMSNEKTLKKHSIKDDFSMLAILTIPVCVAVNFVGGQLASLLKLPMYLDVIGTIFSGMLCGPWVAAVVGAITNLLTSIANPVNLPFIIVNVVVGLTTGWMSRANMFSCWWKTAIALVLQAIISTVVSAPIVVLVYGGVTGSGTSLITATAMAAGANIWAAFFGTEGIFTTLDRVISFFISWGVIRVIPDRTLVKFGCGQNFLKNKGKEKKPETEEAK